MRGTDGPWEGLDLESCPSVRPWGTLPEASGAQWGGGRPKEKLTDVRNLNVDSWSFSSRTQAPSRPQWLEHAIPVTV